MGKRRDVRKVSDREEWRGEGDRQGQTEGEIDSDRGRDRRAE